MELSIRSYGTGRCRVDRALAVRGTDPTFAVLMIREDSGQALGFYHRLGYVRDTVIVASKRLLEDGVVRPAHAESPLQ